jgi:polyisoprenoid-binding protein YceI
MKKTISCLILLFALNSQGATFKAVGQVEFVAKGFPTFITINGKGDGVEGELKTENDKVSSSRLTFPLKSLKTGMDLRDVHMHEKYLETNKHPVAFLELPSFTLQDDGEIEGVLKLHNKENKVKVKYQRLSTGPLSIKASFKILLEDFGIDIPSFQGITVAKEILVKVDLSEERK